MALRAGDHSQAAMTGVKEKVLTLDTMNSSIRRVEYAVRGPIVLRALELEQELRQVCPGPHPHPPGCTWAAQSAPFPPRRMGQGPAGVVRPVLPVSAPRPGCKETLH